uniref:His-Xaa-Ser system protein HxsD n=1 Tax=Angiostrongylus cantonensis TaxID=6313 RepID=A0A0K0CX58_ANGCA
MKILFKITDSAECLTAKALAVVSGSNVYYSQLVVTELAQVFMAFDGYPLYCSAQTATKHFRTTNEYQLDFSSTAVFPSSKNHEFQVLAAIHSALSDAQQSRLQHDDSLMLKSMTNLQSATNQLLYAVLSKTTS